MLHRGVPLLPVLPHSVNLASIRPPLTTDHGLYRETESWLSNLQDTSNQSKSPPRFGRACELWANRLRSRARTPHATPLVDECVVLIPPQCDEVRPSCGNCRKSGRTCPGFPDEFDLIFRNENAAVARRTKRAASKQKGSPSNSSSSPRWVLRPAAIVYRSEHVRVSFLWCWAYLVPTIVLFANSQIILLLQEAALALCIHYPIFTSS